MALRPEPNSPSPSRIRNISSSARWLWNGHCALPNGLGEVVTKLARADAPRRSCRGARCTAVVLHVVELDLVEVHQGLVIARCSLDRWMALSFVRPRRRSRSFSAPSRRALWRPESGRLHRGAGTGRISMISTPAPAKAQVRVRLEQPRRRLVRLGPHDREGGHRVADVGDAIGRCELVRRAGRRLDDRVPVVLAPLHPRRHARGLASARSASAKRLPAPSPFGRAS